MARNIADERWIERKIDGRGGSWGCYYHGRDTLYYIHHIGTVPSMVIAWYNIQLCFRWLKRNIKRRIRWIRGA